MQERDIQTRAKAESLPRETIRNLGGTALDVETGPDAVVAVAAEPTKPSTDYIREQENQPGNLDRQVDRVREVLASRR